MGFAPVRKRPDIVEVIAEVAAPVATEIVALEDLLAEALPPLARVNLPPLDPLLPTKRAAARGERPVSRAQPDDRHYLSPQKILLRASRRQHIPAHPVEHNHHEL